MALTNLVEDIRDAHTTTKRPNDYAKKVPTTVSSSTKEESTGNDPKSPDESGGGEQKKRDNRDNLQPYQADSHQDMFLQALRKRSPKGAARKTHVEAVWDAVKSPFSTGQSQ